MENKKLYQFTLDKEVEKVVESTRKNKKTGEETTTKKTVKEKEPLRYRSGGQLDGSLKKLNLSIRLR